MLKNFLKGTAVVLAVGMAISARADDGISIANGKAKFNALSQFWFVNDNSLGNQSIGAAPNSINNGTRLNMRLRRAEMKFSGALSDTTRWMISVDPTNTASNGSTAAGILNDMAISHNLFMPELELTVGQFKTLTVAESLDPSAELMFPERSMVARTFGERREPGAMVAYKTNMWKLAGMLSNGAGVRNSDSDPSTSTTATQSHPNNKDLSFRFDIKPMEMVSFGAFTALADFNYGQTAVYGVNARVMPIEDLVIRGEVVRARSTNPVDATTGVYAPANVVADTKSLNGWVVDAGYTYGDFQPVLRYEAQQGYNATTTDAITGTAFTAGLNYYMMKHNSKLQFAYTYLGSNTAGSGQTTSGASGFTAPNGSYTVGQGQGGGLTTLALQIAI